MGLSKWSNRIARLAWTKAELRAHLKQRYRRDEQLLISLLAQEGSSACSIHALLNLTRSSIKAVLRTTDDDRKGQMIFASITRRTLFKFYNKEGARLEVKCPLCGIANPLEHTQDHLKRGVPAAHAEEEEQVDFLRALAKTVAPKSKITPDPIQ